MKLLRVTPHNKLPMYINPHYLISIKPHAPHGADLRVYGENGNPVGNLEKTEILHVMESVDQIIETITLMNTPIIKRSKRTEQPIVSDDTELPAFVSDASVPVVAVAEEDEEIVEEPKEGAIILADPQPEQGGILNTLTDNWIANGASNLWNYGTTAPDPEEVKKKEKQEARTEKIEAVKAGEAKVAKDKKKDKTEL